jgi:hypothetical protein
MQGTEDLADKAGGVCPHGICSVVVKTRKYFEMEDRDLLKLKRGSSPRQRVGVLPEGVTFCWNFRISSNWSGERGKKVLRVEKEGWGCGLGRALT